LTVVDVHRLVGLESAHLVAARRSRVRTERMFSCNGWPRVRIEQFGHDAPRAAPQAPPAAIQACAHAR
jgi:hypothetical protein